MSLLIALVVVYLWARNGLNAPYVVVVLAVFIAYLLTPRFVAGIRLRRDWNAMNRSGNEADYNLHYRTLKAASSLSRVIFFEDDHQVATWDGSLNVDGTLLRIVDEDGVASLISNGTVVATARKNERNGYSRSITAGDLEFTMTSLNIGLFPFGFYRDGADFGYARANAIVLPRSVPLEVEVFSYLIALRVFNNAMSRRDRSVGV